MTVGQGRPQVRTWIAIHPTLTSRPLCRWVGWCLCACLISQLSPAESSAQSPASPIDCELRIVWGGGAARTYAGTISVSDGSLQPVRNLSLQTDSIGSVYPENRQSISILPHSPSSFGGVDVSVQGTQDTQLKLRFNQTSSNAVTEYDVPLSELLHGNWLEKLDDRGSRIAIERQLADRLRVTSDRQQHIFDSGEAWKIAIAGYRTNLPAGQYTLNLRFVKSGESIGEPQHETLNVDSDGSFDQRSFDLQLPQSEGAYQLEISLGRRNFLNSFVGTGSPLVRRLDLVVIDSQTKPLSIVGWQPLTTISPLRASRPGSLAWMSSLDLRPTLGMPASIGATDKWQQFNPLAGSLNQPLTNGSLASRFVELKLSTSSERAKQQCLTLGPGDWIALPLHGLEPNHAYRLLMRTPTDQPMQLAMSIQQSNVAGEFPALGLDSGISIGPRQANDQGELAVHEVVFWPRGDKTYALLVNTDKTRRASVLDVQLERAELGPARSDGTPPTSESSTAPTTRMIGINIDKPLLADGVSAARDRDPVTGRALESWNTWQQSAERLCQLMELKQANTLLLKCFSDGGAIFPSEYLEPTYRFDNGTFFSDGRSTNIKDAVELLLRHFDRTNQHLIVGLELDATLPGLARFAQSDKNLATLQQQPVGENQQTKQAATRLRYNPLDARVQEQFLTALRDIVTRYGHHPSFAGIAIQLDQHSQLLFAGDRWGYNAATLESFQQFAQVKLPPRDELESAFSGSLRLAFLEWRAQELTKFFQRAGDVVSRGNTSAKLYLNAIRLWDEFPSRQNFYNPDAIIRNPYEYLLAYGISTESLAAAQSVELMRGAFETTADSVSSQKWIREESGQRGLVEYRSDDDLGSLILQTPQRHALVASEKFDKTGQRWIYPTLFQPQQYARKEIIHQIFHADPLLLIEGGWLPFNGGADSASELYGTLNDLPPLQLDSVPLREQDSNLRVRIGVYRDKTYLQIVNNASWAEEVTLSYQLRELGAAVEVLGNRQLELTASSQSERDAWSFVLPAFDMIAIAISDPQFSLTNFAHKPEANAIRQVESELSELENLVAQAADPTQQKVLANLEGDFERWTDDGWPSGWSVSSLPRVSIGKSLDLPHSGNSSLRIDNQSKTPVSAWIQSRAIQPPTTGRLTVQAWLRAPAVSDPLLVRMSVVGRTYSGERFERSAQAGERGGSGPIAIDWGRKPETLFVGDIPSEDISELYVVIELIGPGTVWVDDLQVFESYLLPEERIHMRGQLLVARQRLTEGNPYPAEQLLESHWGRYLLSLRAPVDKMANLQTPAIREGAPTKQPSWNESPSIFRQLRESMRERWQR